MGMIQEMSFWRSGGNREQKQGFGKFDYIRKFCIDAKREDIVLKMKTDAG
jgi:hypothetical protein